MAQTEDVTRLLEAVNGGDTGAADLLLPLVYEELRRIAHRHMRGERTAHTLNTTALVHEAWIKLADQELTTWQNRLHFFGVASTAMRRILINHARDRTAAKRGGGAPHVSLDEVEPFLGEREAEELVALDEALDRLATFNPRGAAVVTHRFFGGLKHREIAELLGTSEVTVRRSWTVAKSWLRKEVRRRLGFDPELRLTSGSS
ncbi:MAG: sigma-70 family RNA polymerase sigma factor [Gemmatimonadetes bacterium]|nr:sigma-70 family RNA polymerase sigma factor [Gemmatimonadota bacterium]NNF38181.1 sigma-70 family RNA polymerase sigma factor [Gemmatimonadota bacterium]